MKNLELRHNLIIYNKNPTGYIKDNIATVDNIFKNEELSQWLYMQGYETEWKNGVFERLAINRKYYELEDIEPLKNVRVWQLRSDFDIDCRFQPFETMMAKYGEIKSEDYVCVFDGEFSTNDLEQIYESCNAQTLPHGYTGHSMSISDVVELYDGEKSSFHFVDKRGFKEISFKSKISI